MINETKHFGRLASQDKTSKLPDGERWITEYIYYQQTLWVTGRIKKYCYVIRIPFKANMNLFLIQ